jgi:hypothetical protein
MISTKGIKGAGLKKCIPITRFERLSTEPMEAIESEDVLEARMH